MSASVTFTGLDELLRDLRNLPRELADEAGGIVLNAANDASTSIEYPRLSGNLADHLQVQTRNGGEFGAVVVLKNTAKHAHIYESGSQARYNSAGAFRGRMPPASGRQSFRAMSIRARTRMYERLKAMLVRHGATVSGEP